MTTCRQLVRPWIVYVSSSEIIQLSIVALIRRKATSRQTLINDLDKRIAVVNDQMTAKQREINRLQKELDTLQTYYEKLIYNTYKNRDTRVWFLYILSSQDIGQGYRRFAFLKNLAWTPPAGEPPTLGEVSVAATTTGLPAFG